VSPAPVVTPAERAHRDSIRHRDFRARETRAIRAEQVGSSELTGEQLREWSAQMKAETLARHPEWRLA
jgi:hypothetical protein